jgi:hypothetical protein
MNEERMQQGYIVAVRLYFSRRNEEKMVFLTNIYAWYGTVGALRL